MTRTYAILEVHKATFDDVAKRLRDANYDHAFHDDVIDMHGIALKALPKRTEQSAGHDVVSVEVIRHNVGADGTTRFRFTVNVAIDSSGIHDSEMLKTLITTAAEKALTDKRSKFPAFGTSRDDGMPLLALPKRMEQSDGHGGGMAGHDDDIEPLTNHELTELEIGADVGDFGTANGVIERAVDEIRWLRSKLRTRDTEIALLHDKLNGAHTHE